MSMGDGRGSKLFRDLVGVTGLKIVCLALIYLLFFGTSHRMTLDPVSRIAGPATAATTQR
jgi:hypothetical protein